jgi:hypothetical protein
MGNTELILAIGLCVFTVIFVLQYNTIGILLKEIVKRKAAK